MDILALEIHPLALEYPDMTPLEYEAFEADIDRAGTALKPLVIYEGKILDGRHRQKAMYHLLETKGVKIDYAVLEFAGDAKAAEDYVYSMNFARRHLTVSQRGVLADRYWQRIDSLSDDPTVKKRLEGDISVIAASRYNVSTSVVERTRRVRKVAPKLAEDILEGAVTLADAEREIRDRVRKEKREAMREQPLPPNKYRCIVIDPPWPIEKIEREERPNQDAELDYPTMPLSDIAALPIADLAHKEGCHIYLWTTHKFLPEALGLMTAWGARYQCLLTWVKPTGMTPYSWMYNTEHVLFGRIGSLPLEQMGLKLSFDAPTTFHSEKPDVFYDRVRQASPEPRLDMFARKDHLGFEAWGNEVGI